MYLFHTNCRYILCLVLGIHQIDLISKDQVRTSYPDRPLLPLGGQIRVNLSHMLRDQRIHNVYLLFLQEW
ncbi:MAG TPA: hypothetical protein ENI05_13910 [Porticoccus sp.]|nr:hypothetical protein [Porticoccus sp.]